MGRHPDDPERRTRRYLHCDPARDGKMRYDIEPAERWLSIDLSDGLLTVTVAEPYGAGQRGPTRTESVAEQVLAAINGDRPNRSAIAQRIGLKPTDSTVGRALATLVADGTLERHTDRTYSAVLPRDKTDDNTAKRPDCHIANNTVGVGNDKASDCHPDGAETRRG
jgi:hypothetical protein